MLGHMSACVMKVNTVNNPAIQRAALMSELYLRMQPKKICLKMQHQKKIIWYIKKVVLFYCTTITYGFYEQMSHKAQGILCSASCDPDLQLFHQVHAHAVEITQKPEWEKGNSFLMRHPGWKMESIYLTGTKCAWWKAEAHSLLFHKKICHINGKIKLKPTVAAAPSRGLDCPCQYG